MENEHIKHRSWLRRNLTWLFPAILVAITIVYLLISGVIGVGDFAKAYADMPLYENAVQQARQNPRVNEVLGDIAPIDKMTIAEGAVTYAEDNASMTSTITIKGSRGKGKMDIAAHKVDGVWQYSKIGIRIKNPKEEIVVLSQP